mgnify:CR=1 FL=1
MFKGILIEKDDAGYRAAVKDIDEAQLPEGDVTVRVERSSLNYKDGLAITGKGPVVFRTNMEAGHGGKSGRFKAYEDIALEYAFILDLAAPAN